MLWIASSISLPASGTHSALTTCAKYELLAVRTRPAQVDVAILLVDVGPAAEPGAASAALDLDSAHGGAQSYGRRFAVTRDADAGEVAGRVFEQAQLGDASAALDALQLVHEGDPGEVVDVAALAGADEAHWHADVRGARFVAAVIVVFRNASWLTHPALFFTPTSRAYSIAIRLQSCCVLLESPVTALVVGGFQTERGPEGTACRSCDTDIQARYK